MRRIANSETRLLVASPGRSVPVPGMFCPKSHTPLILRSDILEDLEHVVTDLLDSYCGILAAVTTFIPIWANHDVLKESFHLLHRNIPSATLLVRPGTASPGGAIPARGSSVSD